MDMKRSMKRLGLVGLTLVGLLSVAACGNDKKESSKSSDMKIGGDIIKDDTTLEVYASKGKMQNYIKDMLDIYNKKNGTKVKAKFTTVASGTATVQMITPKLVSNEEMPDIVSIADSSAAGILTKFENSFYSASDYGFYDKYGKDFYSQKLGILKEQSSKKQVIPYANDYTAALSFYQPEYFEKAGVKFEDIKSWDQFIEVAKKIKKDSGINSLALPESGDQEFFIDVLNQQNVGLLDNKGNINLGKPEAEETAKLIKKMVDADIVNFYGANDGEKTFQESAMFVAGGWYAMNMSLNFPNASGKWRMAPLVPFSESNPGKSPISGGSSWYVPKKSKSPEVAQQFLSFALSDENCLQKALEDGVAVSNKNAYKTKAVDTTFEYFGNQKYYEVLNKANNNTAEISLPASYSDATAYVATATHKYWKDGNYKDSYEKEADNYAQKYNLKVNK